MIRVQAQLGIGPAYAYFMNNPLRQYFSQQSYRFLLKFFDGVCVARFSPCGTDAETT